MIPKRVGLSVLLITWALSFILLPGFSAPNPAAKTLVQGGQAAGATNTQYPVVTSGATSSGVIRTLRVDDDGAVATAPGASALEVEGDVADGTALTGINPVLGGGQDGTNIQALSTDTSGRLRTVADPFGGSTSSLADGNVTVAYVPTNTAAGAPGAVGVGVGTFNGTAWERARSNSSIEILPTLARTTAQAVEFTNYSGKAVHVVLDVTAIAATPVLTLTIEGKDEVSGKFYTLLAGAAVSTVSTNVYRVGPGLTAAANLVANDFVPRAGRIRVAVADADSATYSVGIATVN